MLQVVESCIVCSALYGLITTIIFVFNKNKKVEKFLYNSISVMSIFVFLVVALFLFFSL